MTNLSIEVDRMLGRDAIFRDIESTPMGVPFAKYVAESMHDCAVVLVFIGKDWLTISDNMGKRRLEDSEDYVRTEIETALGTQVCPDVSRPC